MKKVWKKGQKGQYQTLKEARTAARELSSQFFGVRIEIFEESDKSFSVRKPTDALAKFVMAIDKSGFKWKKIKKQKQMVYVPYEG